MKKLLTLLFCVAMSFQVKATTDNMENIKVIVSYPPGSGADTVFRILQAYGLKRNINFVPEFKPGAQGLIAAEHAINQPKDGKTLLLAGISDLTNTSPLKKIDYTDFISVSAISSMHYYLVANKKFPKNNLTQIVDMLKQDSQSVTFSTQGVKQNVTFKETFAERGINKEELRLIPYNPVQGLTAVIGGHVDIGLFPGAVLKGVLESNQVKVLASLAQNDDIDAGKNLESIQGPESGVDGIAVFVPLGTNTQMTKFWQDFIDDFKQDKEAQASLVNRYFNLFKGKGSSDLDRIIKKQLMSTDKYSLTFRQQEIAKLIINRGLSNEQIANTLNLSEATVKLHAGLVYKKYGVKNRIQLIAIEKNNFG